MMCAVSSPSHHREAVAWAIATLRAGRSREDASRAARMNVQWVGRIERLEVSPRAEDLFRLLAALGASATAFGELYDRRIAELKAEAATEGRGARDGSS